MALEHILAAIRGDGAAELAKLEAAGDEEVRRIEQAAREEAERAVQRALDDDVVRTARAVRGIEGAAAADAARALGDAREAVFVRLREGVAARLAALPDDPGWPGVLAALLTECLTALPDATTVHVHPRDVAHVEGLAGGHDVRGDLDGWGVVVRAADGREVDNRLDTRLLTAEPELRRLARARVAALREAS